jgi:hypothetical protein
MLCLPIMPAPATGGNCVGSMEEVICSSGTYTRWVAVVNVLSHMVNNELLLLLLVFTDRTAHAQQSC